MTKLSLKTMLVAGFSWTLLILVLTGALSCFHLHRMGESRAIVQILVVVGAGIVGSLGVAIYTSRNVAARVSQIVEAMQVIAQGDLSIEDLPIAHRDELGEVGTSLNALKNYLHDVLRGIVGIAGHLAEASRTICSTAGQNAKGCGVQSDHANQLAAAMQEMSASFAEVSRNSARAAESAQQATEIAKHGGRIVDDALTSMHSIADAVGAAATQIGELGKSSDQIGRIVAVIDDIANQTNLLALNAAIEAARAGDQGRGFAVVAGEVGRLAERTVDATKEIATTISAVQRVTADVVAQMQAGTRQVEAGLSTTSRAGASLGEIITAAQQVGEMVSQIAVAAAEQTAVAEQFSNSINEIASIAFESALSTAKEAQACDQVSGLATSLEVSMSGFTLEGTAAEVCWNPAQIDGQAETVAGESRMASSDESTVHYC
jgi:methyl-accepting chemotaxis protein